jgi:hypothetical protein
MIRGRHIWTLAVIALLVTVLLSGLAFGAPCHLACGLLPYAGALDILPPGPTAQLAEAQVPAGTCDPLLAALPPRGPPA